MTRIVLVDQDLSGQIIKGQPFSYIGRCTGTDIKFVGDWTHVSHFGNDFLRPDWSKAQTRWSYSRYNTFRDILASPDAEILDHEMMLALLDAGRQQVTGKTQLAAATVVAALDSDRVKQDYLISWGNLTPAYMKKMGKDAESAFRTTVGGREHLVRHLLKQASADPKEILWDGDEGLEIETEGIKANEWGVTALARDGREYRKHGMELPLPKNPHDRVEMAELIEAEIEEATDIPATLYIQSIIPWRSWGTWGRKPRDWPMVSFI